MYFYFFFIFILGLCVGSFLNVVIDHWPHGRSLGGRSLCEHCHRPLAVRDLVPLLSWLGLKGSCRYCHHRLSRQYPLVELTTGLLFLIVAYWRGLSLEGGSFLLGFVSLFYYLFIVSVLLVAAVIDLKEGLVLEAVVFPAILVTLAYRIFSGSSRLVSLYLSLKRDERGLGPYLLRTDFLRERSLLELRSFLLVVAAATAAALLFWLIIKLTRGRGMGLGDVWLGFLVGIVTGFPEVLVAVFLAFVLGALVSLGLLLAGKKRFGETVPFGPFLSAAALLTIFFGDKLFSWYLTRI